MSLRDRKRARTRKAIVEAATELFERHGYDRTTVADIAAAADIGTRTFFGYFSSKEELLFPETAARLRAAREAIAARGPDDRPADVLLAALRIVGEDSDDLSGRLAALRLDVIRTVPAVRGRALQVQSEVTREIGRYLAAAFPDELDDVSATAMAGAFAGAVSAALQVLLEDLDERPAPAVVQAAVERATEVALGRWRG